MGDVCNIMIVICNRRVFVGLFRYERNYISVNKTR